MCCGDPREGALLDNPREFQLLPYLELRAHSPSICWNQHGFHLCSFCVSLFWKIFGRLQILVRAPELLFPSDLVFEYGRNHRTQKTLGKDSKGFNQINLSKMPLLIDSSFLLDELDHSKDSSDHTLQLDLCVHT